MSEDDAMDFKDVAHHISEYIDNGKLFDTFGIRDIEKIMKQSKLTADQYINLLKQSSLAISANDLYICTREANVFIQNIEEVISILKSVKTYMKFNIFDGIIDVLNQTDKELCDATEENKKLHELLKELQSQIQNIIEYTTVEQNNENNDDSEDILTKIAELKESGDFESVYAFLDELSKKGNEEMIAKACEKGLCNNTILDNWNALHFACIEGNLRLVKSLIGCNFNKESKDYYGRTPLFYVPYKRPYDVIQYLISVGANIEAKDNSGYTPLICSSIGGELAGVKYLISVGANKEAKDNHGRTPLIHASSSGHHEIVQYLISVGANKEAKDNDGRTPLIHASSSGHHEIVQYLISVGANKEAKDNHGRTPLIHALSNGHHEIVQYLISVGANNET